MMQMPDNAPAVYNAVHAELSDGGVLKMWADPGTQAVAFCWDWVTHVGGLRRLRIQQCVPIEMFDTDDPADLGRVIGGRMAADAKRGESV
jgi:hypothetical protein